MENRIEEGCLAVVVQTAVPENLGKLVRVGKFVGKVFPYAGTDRWEVDIDMLSTKGTLARHQRESHLLRVTDMTDTVIKYKKPEVVTNLKVGDKVTVNDGSWAVRMDEYEDYTSIGLCTDTFKIITIRNTKTIEVVNAWSSGCYVHDCRIKNLSNGNIYLHSLCMLTKVEEPPMEITMAELEEKYGRKVNIIK